MMGGDFHELEFPLGEYDMAMIANVTHLEKPENTCRLFAKIYESLKPGGELLVVDVLPGSQEGDLPRALYKIGLALRTESARVYDPAELASFLRDAGFSDPQSLPLDVPPYTVGMMLARRPD